MMRPLTFCPLVPLGTCLFGISALRLRASRKAPEGLFVRGPMADEPAVKRTVGSSIGRTCIDTPGTLPDTIIQTMIRRCCSVQSVQTGAW